MMMKSLVKSFRSKVGISRLIITLLCNKKCYVFRGQHIHTKHEWAELGCLAFLCPLTLTNRSCLLGHVYMTAVT